MRLNEVGLLALIAMLLATPASASWPAQGLLVEGGPRAQFNPIPSPDGAGGTFVCWCSMVDDTSGDLRLVRIHPGGEVALGWPAHGIALQHMPMQADYPLYPLWPIALTADGSGGVFAAIGTTVWHVNGLGGFAAGWPAAGRSLIPTGVFVGGGAMLAADDAGGIFACWSDMQDGDMHVRAQHLRASGDPYPGWPANGLTFSNPYWAQRGSMVVPDGAGGAWLGWIEDGRLPGLASIRGMSYQRIVHHALANGTVDPAAGTRRASWSRHRSAHIWGRSRSPTERAAPCSCGPIPPETTSA